MDYILYVFFYFFLDLYVSLIQITCIIFVYLLRSGRYLDSIQKQVGFEQERLYVLPEYITRELIQSELTQSLFVSDIGYFPHAKYHYRERSEGSDAHIFIYCAAGEGWVELNGE